MNDSYRGWSYSFLWSLGVVVETVATIGPARDSTVWASPTIQLLTVAVQLTDVTAVFLTIPLFVAPWAKQSLETTVPVAVDGYEDHVVLCELTARGVTLIDEIDAWNREFVVVERDYDRAAAIRGRPRPSYMATRSRRKRSKRSA